MKEISRAMKTQLLLGVSILLPCSPLPANEMIDLEVDANGSVSWQGEVGHVYFLQWSTDFVTWDYVPLIYTGTGTFSWQYSASDVQFFCRVRAVYVPSVNPNSDDFDDDGISNLDELTHQINGQSAQLDPLNADTDGDGISDGTEVALGTNPSVKDHAKDWSGTKAIVLTPTT